MGALMRSVPKEMWGTLGAKKTVKEAWETIKTTRIRADRVKEVNIQKLLKEFENIEFKEGESVADFGMRIINLVTNIKSLGEVIDDTRVVKKFLRVVPSRFNQVAVSIEMFCDMSSLTVEDLVGRLRAAEDHLDNKLEHITDKASRLLLAEDEWLEKHKHRFQGSSQKEGNNGSAGQWKPKMTHRSDVGSSGSSNKGKLTSKGTPRRKGRCKNCGIYGHWAQDCKRPKKDDKEHKPSKANIAADDTEHAALLFAQVEQASGGSTLTVHLAEDKVVPVVCPDEVWVLDTGASNHMTRTRSVLSHMNNTMKGSLCFGDGSTVEICGLGLVVIKGRHDQHKVLTNVYYIPKLKSNIVSLGQLEEAGCDIRLSDGCLKVFDTEYNLLISAPRTGNRLYTVKSGVDAPMCLLTRKNDVAWQWHSRFGHLNFRALRDLGRKEMVEGLPLIDQVEQVCDGCTLYSGKTTQNSFPKGLFFQSKERFGLVSCRFMWTG
jgi:hypothetical protein